MSQESTVQVEAPRPPIAPHGEPLWFDVLNEYRPEQGHFIEQSVQVYLRVSADGGRWLIDGATVDGYGLDAVLDDPSIAECTCGRGTECATARHQARDLALPSASELMHMLAESLGYEVRKKDAC